MNRRRLTSAALLWAGCAAVYFLTAPGRIDMIDGGVRYDVTASLIDTGRPIVRDPFLPSVWAPDGFRYAFYPLGTSLAAVPFVKLGAWLGHDAVEAKQFAFSLTSVPFSAGAVALLFLIYGRLGLARKRALAWSLVAAFCTPLWPYAGSTFDIGLQAFFLTCAVWAAIEAIASDSPWWAAASGIGFAALFNIQEIYAVLGACVVFAVPFRWSSIAERLRQRAVQQIVLGMIAGVVLVLAYNAYKFGHPLDTGRTRVPHPLLGNPLVGFAGLLASPAKSILLYSPPYVLGLVGLRRLIRMDGARFGPLAACLVLHVALISSLRFWAGEWAWGPRYLIASLPLVCIGMPFVTGGRTVVRALCALGLAVQLLAVSVDHQRFYFERSFAPFFWVDDSIMYKQSALFARPGEIVAILERRDLDGVRALVPGPRPSSMTSWIYGPPPEILPRSPEWMRQYLVFLVPRPWPLWSRYLPPEQRPGRVGLMTLAGALVALTSFGLLLRSTETRTGD
jgi:hypothetical protein